VTIYVKQLLLLPHVCNRYKKISKILAITSDLDLTSNFSIHLCIWLWLKSSLPHSCW
jgi:hypothetical protein